MTVLNETGRDTEILVVGGRSFAFGLRWTSGAGPRQLLAEAKDAAIAEGANFVAIHRGYGQFGLASISSLPTGWPRFFYRPRSGVATIAATAGAATLAAFPLADGRWLVIAIDRNGILPDGDIVVVDADDARARIERLIAQSPTSWRRKFMPAEWGIPDSRQVDPTTLLSGVSGVGLTPLWALANRTRIRVWSAASAAILAATIAVAVRFEGEAPQVAVVPLQAPKPVPALWIPAGPTLDACLSALRAAQRYNAVPGWIPAKYTCQDGQALIVNFSRAGAGQVSVMRSLLPAARLSDDGRAAVLAIPLAALPQVSANGAFAAPEQYRIVGLDLAQRLNGSFGLQAGKRMLPGEADATPPNQAWKLFTWTYQTQAPAIVWAGALARLGAISVDTLVFSPSDNLWQITGSLYASH
jgi:hypothetical protein